MQTFDIDSIRLTEKVYLASDSNTAPEILEELGRDNAPEVRERVAENPNTPIKILEKLSKDEEPWVRMDVAENPNTPITVLEKMKEDSYIGVRGAVFKAINKKK